MTKTQQYTITHGDWAAVVDQRGARLVSLTLAERELLWNDHTDGPPRTYQGDHLLPWPNRIRDGVYKFGGQDHQLEVNEKEAGNALHGLAYDEDWTLVIQEEDAVVQRVVVDDEQGWPYRMVAEIRTGLGPDGLTIDVTAANDGSEPFPFGYGGHPYFRFHAPGTALELPFSRELLTDDRGLPTELVDVTEQHDFREPRRIEDTTFDTAFTGAVATEWQVSLADDDITVTIWGDGSTPWVQVYTHPRHDGIAVEPMTCGPDAFNPGPTREGRIVLEPGQVTTARWGVTAG